MCYILMYFLHCLVCNQVYKFPPHLLRPVTLLTLMSDPRNTFAQQRVNDCADSMLQRLLQKKRTISQRSPSPPAVGREPSVEAEDELLRARTLSVEPNRDVTLPIEADYLRERTLVIESMGVRLTVIVPDPEVLVETVPTTPTFRAVETQTDPIEIFPLPPQDPMFLRCEDEVDDDEPPFTPYKNAVEDFPTEQGIHAEVSEELQDLLDKYDTFYDDEDHAKDLQSAHIALVESLFKCIVTAYDHPDTGMELKFSIGFGIDKYPDDVKMDVLQNYKVELMSNFYTRDHNYLNCFFEYVVNDLLEASAEARDDQMRNYIRTNPEAMEAIKTKLVARLINQ